MEELLNKLIKGWWKPRWENEPIYMLSSKKLYIPDTMEVNRSLRDLVSKESGLWQFVCEMSVNNYNKEKWKVLTWKKFEDNKYQINWYSNWWWYIQDYEYWLIESALKDEDKLEKFLLENIKIS